MTSPGRLSGTTTCTIAWTSPQPSTQAASSISGGSALKKPTSSHVQNGIVNAGYTTTSAHQESNNPSVPTIRASGRNNTIGGTRYVTKIAVPSVCAAGSRKRASAYPAGTAATSVIGRTHAMSRTVFRSDRGNSVLKNSVS